MTNDDMCYRAPNVGTQGHVPGSKGKQYPQDAPCRKHPRACNRPAAQSPATGTRRDQLESPQAPPRLERRVGYCQRDVPHFCLLLNVPNIRAPLLAPPPHCPKHIRTHCHTRSGSHIPSLTSVAVAVLPGCPPPQRTLAAEGLVGTASSSHCRPLLPVQPPLLLLVGWVCCRLVV